MRWLHKTKYAFRTVVQDLVNIMSITTPLAPPDRSDLARIEMLHGTLFTMASSMAVVAEARFIATHPHKALHPMFRTHYTRACYLRLCSQHGVTPKPLRPLAAARTFHQAEAPTHKPAA